MVGLPQPCDWNEQDCSWLMLTNNRCSCPISFVFEVDKPRMIWASLFLINASPDSTMCWDGQYFPCLVIRCSWMITGLPLVIWDVLWSMKGWYFKKELIGVDGEHDWRWTKHEYIHAWPNLKWINLSLIDAVQAPSAYLGGNSGP